MVATSPDAVTLQPHFTGVTTCADGRTAANSTNTIVNNLPNLIFSKFGIICKYRKKINTSDKRDKKKAARGQPFQFLVFRHGGAAILMAMASPAVMVTAFLVAPTFTVTARAALTTLLLVAFRLRQQRTAG